MDWVALGNMDSPFRILSLAGATVLATAAVFPKLQARLALSRAKHRSLSGHSKMSKRVARLIPFYEFDIGDFFRSDGAPAEVGTRRQRRLLPPRAHLPEPVYLQPGGDVAGFRSHFRPAIHRDLPGAVSYSRLVREHLGAGAFVQSSAGVTVTDLDGNVFYDLTGSYGVNIFGNDFYKDCIAKAETRARGLLGARTLSSRYCRQCRATARDFGPRRGFVPHVRQPKRVMQAVEARSVTPPHGR